MKTSTVQKAKNSLRACAFNILDLCDKQIYEDEKKMKVIQNLRRELVILKPDKGNGIVVISIADYYKSIDHLFFDTSKFRQLKEDPIQMRLLSLQNFLLKLKNRNEISESIYKQIRPQNAKPGRAHSQGL